MSYFGRGATSQSILEAIEHEEDLSIDRGESSQEFVAALIEVVSLIIQRELVKYQAVEVHK